MLLKTVVKISQPRSPKNQSTSVIKSVNLGYRRVLSGRGAAEAPDVSRRRWSFRADGRSHGSAASTLCEPAQAGAGWRAVAQRRGTGDAFQPARVEWGRGHLEDQWSGAGGIWQVGQGAFGTVDQVGLDCRQGEKIRHPILGAFRSTGRFSRIPHPLPLGVFHATQPSDVKGPALQVREAEMQAAPGAQTQKSAPPFLWTALRTFRAKLSPGSPCKPSQLASPSCPPSSARKPKLPSQLARKLAPATPSAAPENGEDGGKTGKGGATSKTAKTAKTGGGHGEDGATAGKGGGTGQGGTKHDAPVRAVRACLKRPHPQVRACLNLWAPAPTGACLLEFPRFISKP